MFLVYRHLSFDEGDDKMIRNLSFDGQRNVSTRGLIIRGSQISFALRARCVSALRASAPSPGGPIPLKKNDVHAGRHVLQVLSGLFIERGASGGSEVPVPLHR